MRIRQFVRAVAGVALAVQSGACVAEDSVDDASASTCSAERYLVEQAVEAYIVLEGTPPTSEAALIPNYLRRESASMDVDSAGNVVAAPGSGCI